MCPRTTPPDYSGSLSSFIQKNIPSEQLTFQGENISRDARLSLRWIVWLRWFCWLYRLWFHLRITCLVFTVLGLLLDLRHPHLFAGFLPVFHHLFLRQLGLRGCEPIRKMSSLIYCCFFLRLRLGLCGMHGYCHPAK